MLGKSFKLYSSKFLDVPQIPCCFYMLLIRPPPPLKKNLRRLENWSKLIPLKVTKLFASKSKFHGSYNKPVNFSNLTPSFSCQNYRNDKRVKPGKYVTRWCFSPTSTRNISYFYPFFFRLLFCYTGRLSLSLSLVNLKGLNMRLVRGTLFTKTNVNSYLWPVTNTTITLP